MISHFLEKAVGLVWNYPVIILCLFTGFYFTFFRMNFIQFKCFSHAVQLLKGKYDDPNEVGQITHFQALSAALSATIGLGNIAGVAIAIALGGPGAIFWMWLVGLLGMATKFVECTLGTHYRDENKVTKETRGGPMYYIEKGLGKKWKPMAIFFAVCTLFGALGAGGMFQANQAASALFTYYDVPIGLTGSILAIFVALVIIGGIKRIGNVASKIVPSMCVIYVLGAFFICLSNIDKIPYVFSIILNDAFTGQAAAGGSLGMVILMGVRRAVFSNEAGLGSASIAHAAVKTHYPVREGIVASMGPLIDTIIVCTATAAVIIMGGFFGTEMYTRDNSSKAHFGFEKTDNAVRLNDGWSHSVKAPNSHDKIRSYRDGEQVLVYQQSGTTHGRVSLPAIPIPKDSLRFSYFRKAGDMAILIKDENNRILTGFNMRDKTNQGYYFPAGEKNRMKAASIQNYDSTAEWSSALITLSDEFRAILKKEKINSIKVDIIPIGSSVHFFIDRFQAVEKLSGISLTIAAFDKFFKGFGTIFITFAVILFAFSTMISWSYYGETASVYAFGKQSILPFKLIFIVGIFIGSVKPLSMVLNFTDLMIGLMVIPNSIAILALSKEVAKMTKTYFKELKEGKYPLFH
ncbi:hypothetical protein DID77_00185 [Candidatus Marinamargulisbacteria bacterium SCGC AG-439-L15]|nr:hypothetical protein DID77_00185 [Candidatus Marinamargulisbacteria bacterium SCGC AG-439-L15]